jgi:Cyclophilin type peptidyl-prolyl cis-trans isomerase/CLD
MVRRSAVWLMLSFAVSSSAAVNDGIPFIKTTCDPGPHSVEFRTQPDHEAPASFGVRWKTTASQQDLVLQVYRDWAPIGVDRFYQLLLDNYYNCAAFFRVVPGKMGLGQAAAIDAK